MGYIKGLTCEYFRLPLVAILSYFLKAFAFIYMISVAQPLQNTNCIYHTTWDYVMGRTC
jgi:hypothetical protein